MKKKGIRKPPTAVLIAIITVIAAVSLATAWLIVNPEVLNRWYSLSNFDAYAATYFEQTDNSRVIPTKNGDGTITVDITTPTAVNYIGKLRVSANYKGKGSAYMRLKMVQQWQDSDGKILQSNAALPYNIINLYSKGLTGNQSKWYDNRNDDMCLYYATRLRSTQGNTSYDTIPIIGSNFNTAQFNAMIPTGNGTVTLKLAFELQVIQVNRYPQFWGMQTLPWLETLMTTTTG